VSRRIIEGLVVKGEGIGRKIGFPTANIQLDKGARPPRGVWRVYVSSDRFGERLAVCNVGYRPTLNGRSLCLEVHIPKFRGNLYGQTLKIRFDSAIRAEKKFESIEQLKHQIKRDIASLTASPPTVTMNA
jgi:riboflavin kinase/FMN adenylyltransferase